MRFPPTRFRTVLVGLGLIVALSGAAPLVATADTTTTTSTTTTTVPVTTTTVHRVTKPKIIVHKGPSLSLGSRGPDVTWLQKRLGFLHYWVGGVTGVFGDATQQAVYAFQKAANLPRDGVVGPSTYRALAHTIQPKVRSKRGIIVEVNLKADLLVIVKNGNIKTILNTSTGGGYTYTSDGVTSVADTPVGRYQILRQINGLVTDSLGQLWRPKYFYSGFAIHGDSYVPPIPVSHGCVRLSNEAINWVWNTNQMPIGTHVWVYN